MQMENPVLNAKNTSQKTQNHVLHPEKLIITTATSRLPYRKKWNYDSKSVLPSRKKCDYDGKPVLPSRKKCDYDGKPVLPYRKKCGYDGKTCFAPSKNACFFAGWRLRGDKISGRSL
jgi:hypothetical protein